MDRAPQNIELKIDGMSCGNCVAHVTRTLNSLEGVKTESVQIGSAVVAFDPALVNPARIEEALAEDGYPARAATGG